MSVDFTIKKGKTKTYTVKDKGIVKIISLELSDATVSNGFRVKRFYKAEDKIIAYCNDNKLYELNSDNSFSEYYSQTFTSEPEIIDFFVDGVSQVLMIASDKAVIKKNNIFSNCTTIPYGKQVEYFKDKLFTANGNVLNYSKPTVPNDFTSNIVSGGFYKTDLKDGDICGLFCKDDKLFIVNKRAITEIKVNGDEKSFVAKKLAIPFIDIVENSFAKKGDICTFVSDNKRVVFDGTKLEFYDFFNTDNLTVTGGYFYKDYYLLKSDRLNNYKLFYSNRTGDVSGKIENEQSAFGYGVGYRNSYRKIYRTVEVEESLGYNGNYDFGTAELKAITLIGIKIKGMAVLTVKGDFGIKKYQLKRGENAIYCNSCSKNFVITISDEMDEFCVENFIIKYKIHGG